MIGQAATMISSSISLHSVSKQYGTGSRAVHALVDVSFAVPQGGFISVLGPSGCGKTTLVSLIAGFLHPTSGDILINGVQVLGPGPDRTVVFQELHLFQWKTAYGNVELGLKACHMPTGERQRTVHKYLSLVGLSDAADRYPFQLSGGMRQRLALARALAVNPGCVLMDEPLGALDSQMRLALQDELQRIWDQTRQTILMVTHDVDEALYLSDSLVVLTARPGSVQAVIPVPLPRPRIPEMRLMPEFQMLKREVLDFLGRSAV